MARQILDSSFMRGFVLTLLVLSFALVLLGPTTGLAQGGGTPNVDSLVAGDSNQPARSDSPRYPAPIAAQAQAAAPLSNRESNPNDVTSFHGSDSPRYPVQVAPPAQSGAPESNGDTAHLSIAPSSISGPAEPTRGDASNLVAAGYTSPLVIPGADFRADGLSPSSIFFSFGGGSMAGTAAGYGCVMAPAYLPNGATVYQFWASVYDNDATFNVTVTLRRVNNYSGVETDMASVATTGQSTLIQSLGAFAITDPTVLYPDYSYYVTTCLLSSTSRLYTARLWYTGP